MKNTPTNQPPVSADETAIEKAIRSAQEAVAAARTHADNLVFNKWNAFDQSYAKEITLMPGHGYLSPEVGLAKSNDKAVEIDRDKLISTVQKFIEGLPDEDTAPLSEFFGSLIFQEVTMTPGEYRADEAEPEKTDDGELRFQIEKGDVLVKATPAKRNVLFFQMREIEGTWRVVAEYTG